MTGHAIRTVEEQVLDVLRERTLDGTYPPGVRLKLREISEDLGVSTQPVRVALQRLESEGLVEPTGPHRGVVVAPMDMQTLEEIQAVRTALESHAAWLGSQRVTDLQLSAMRQGIGGLASTRDVESLVRAEWAVYDICYLAAGRPRLLTEIHEHRDLVARYVRLAMSWSDERIDEARNNAELFVSACERREIDQVASVVRTVLSWVPRHLQGRLPDRDHPLT